MGFGQYFPRLTMASAAHHMNDGNVMQIGCSQGKTSVVALSTMEQLMMGKKVFSTSSAPGLVPENYDEARAQYEGLGIADQFCAVSRNEEVGKDTVTLLHDGKKYEIRDDGTVYEVAKEDKKNVYKEVKLDSKEIEGLTIAIGEDGKVDFEETVRKVFAEKGIIMGDTNTLQKYQHLIETEKTELGDIISNSFLIVDEADVEVLDAKPQEILGNEISEEDRIQRNAKRKELGEKVLASQDIPEDLVKDVEGEDLEYILDALEAKQYFINGKVDPSKVKVEYDKDGKGKIMVLNESTNVFGPATQGVSQMLMSIDEDFAQNAGNVPEHEVEGVTDNPEFFSKFLNVSLMSGTMQDKGLSLSSPELQEAYRKARMEYFQRICPALGAAIAKRGVIDWDLVTPLTREEKGDVVITMADLGDEEGKKNGLKVKDDGKIETVPDEVKIDDWEEYLKGNGDALDKRWRQAIEAEAKRRSEGGQPVMISVYGDRNPVEGNSEIKTYTAKKQIGDDHKFGDDKFLGVEGGKGEIACFDDFYGRGYTFKFYETENNQPKVEKKVNGKGEVKDEPIKAEKGGHVLITALPQNSRNLEQFLFRVARGGDKGSSSIIISPNDPVLKKYLKTLDKAQANEFLQGVLNGTIPVEKIVASIYHEATKKLFVQKLGQIELNNYLQERIEIEDVNNTLGETERKQLGKRLSKYLKYGRIVGVPEDEDKKQSLKTKLSGLFIRETRKSRENSKNYSEENNIPEPEPQQEAIIQEDVEQETKPVEQEAIENNQKPPKMDFNTSKRVMGDISTRATAEGVLEATETTKDIQNEQQIRILKEQQEKGQEAQEFEQ